MLDWIGAVVVVVGVVVYSYAFVQGNIRSSFVVC